MAAKNLHMMFAMLSISLFYLRAFSRIFSLKTASNRIIYVTSHTIDTAFLLSGVYLVTLLQLNPLINGWLLEKLVCVVVYIGLGFVLVKQTQRRAQLFILLLSTLCLGLIGFLATHKNAFIV